jgi:hypothetical protein
MQRHRSRRTRVAIAGTLVALAAAGSAEAFQALPLGGQVNDDLAAGINKAISVGGDEPTNADVVGGALVAGKPNVPWSVFRQQENGGADAPAADQIFSRSFANGAWTTRGNGTVGGRSSAAPTFKGSLNFDQSSDGEAPAIDFAGAGRTVPWATWYENTSGAGFGADNVFASRFDNTGDANQGKWIFGGQARGTGGGSVQIPSLNIHTNESAENPSVAGGSAADATKPGPWITWQETDNLPVDGRDQIFVSRPEGPGMANCDGVTPAGVTVGGHVPSIGGFCWQQTGIPRVGTSQQDPSLNVDPTRNGVEPDIAFTGKNAAGVQDGVPWVVWYEKDNSSISGLRDNEMVFAAKGISDGVAANGGFHWVAVGNQVSGTLDTSGTNGFGSCASSAANEQGCSLNRDPTRDAEDPQVAAGTMTPGQRGLHWALHQPERPDVRPRRVGHPAHTDLTGRCARADFLELHGESVQLRWCSLSGRTRPHAVLPLHQRQESASPLRGCSYDRGVRSDRQAAGARQKGARERPGRRLQARRADLLDRPNQAAQDQRSRRMAQPPL